MAIDSEMRPVFRQKAWEEFNALRVFSGMRPSDAVELVGRAALFGTVAGTVLLATEKAPEGLDLETLAYTGAAGLGIILMAYIGRWVSFRTNKANAHFFQ